MNECQFEYDKENEVHHCKVCGREIKAPEDSIVTAYCKVQEPTLPEKIIHYAGAVLEHIATGAQKRTDEETEYILQICQGCKFFTERGTCLKCGCRCNSNKSPLVNKIRMESQHCPTGQW